LLRLRSIAGKSIGCNYDPSHMFWQGIDPIKAIRVLGDSIFHVHAKDTQIYDSISPDRRAGYQEIHRRKESPVGSFRSVGYGHALDGGKNSISTLRMYGYDYVLSIEHEDTLMSPDEGLSKAAEFLNANRDPRPADRALVV